MHCFAEHPKSRHAADGSLRIGGLQAKLAVSSPGDVYEQEADRMAEQVLRMPDAATSPGSPCRGSCAQCQPPEGLLRKSAGAAERSAESDVPPASESAIHAVAGGQGLSEQQRSYFEPLFGADFSGVRLHTGPAADLAAASIGALAYTRGRDVVFRRDHYQPDTPSGQKLLAHELAHTVQQGSAPAKPPPADRSNGNFFSPLQLHSKQPSVLRLQRQEELHNRTLQELFVVTESLEAFQQAIEEWLAHYVMSSATREEALVRASNLAALHQQLVIGMPGQTVRIQATLEAGTDRYERVIFSTPGLTILDPIAITGSPQEAGSLQESDSDSDEAESGAAPLYMGNLTPDWAYSILDSFPAIPRSLVKFPFRTQCITWIPADEERTWGLIHRFLAEGNGYYSNAFRQYSEERNQLQNCCDLSYTAAGHYLFIITESIQEYADTLELFGWGYPPCGNARWMAGLRTFAGAVISGQRVGCPVLGAQPVDIFRSGACPPSPYDSIVTEFQFRAADFACAASDEFIRRETGPIRGERGLSLPQPQPQSESTEAPP